MKKTGVIYTKQAEDRMFRLARTLLGNDEEAMDTVHDILEKLWRLGPDSLSMKNPEAYALQSTRNACIDRLRSRRKQTDSMPEIPVRPEAEKWNAKQTVRSAMRQLPERQKTVIHLKDIEGYSADEIGQMLGMSGSNVRMTLSRARKALRDIILQEMRHER